MSEKSISGRLLSIVILGMCLLFFLNSETSLYAGQNKGQQNQTKAKKTDPVDLSIQDFTLSKSKVPPGAKVSMQFHIRLKGMFKGSSHVDIYLTSQRHKYSRKNRIYRRIIRSSHFNAQGIVHLQKYHKFPLTHSTGNFYFILVVDPGRAVREWNEKNNVAARTIQVKQEAMQLMGSRLEVNPDVALKQVKVTPQEIKDGKSFNVSFYVTNRSKVHIAEVDYKVYIKKKGGFFGSTTHNLETGLCRNLAPNSQQHISLNASIPLNMEMPSPPNYLHVVVDPGNKLNEKSADRRNNSAKLPITITITSWPDLGVRRFRTNLAGSGKNRLPRRQELKLDITFKNYGNRKAEPCRYLVMINYWRIKRNFSGDPVSARWVQIDKKEYDIHHLKPNETQFSSVRFTTGSWEPGQYRIVLLVDPTNLNLESNENNNTLQRSFKIY